MNNVHIRDEVDEKAVSDGCPMWWNIYFTRVRELNIFKSSEKGKIMMRCILTKLQYAWKNLFIDVYDKKRKKKDTTV